VIRPRVQFVTVLAAAVLLVTACGGGPATAPPLSATSAPSGMGASPAASVEPLSPAQVSADSAALDALEKLAHDVPNEPHDTVKAPDGSAELLIPSGALPSGTSAQDVSITRVDPAQAGITEAGNPPIAGWQFSPDGLQFTSPALFLVLNDGQPAGTASAMASLTGDGTVESVPQLSGDGQETTAGQDAWSAAAPVSHFSGLFELKVPNIKLDIPQSEPFRYVGQEFSAHVNFSQDVNGATTMFLIKSLFTANGPLEPSEQEGIPMGLEELPGSELPYVGSDNARLTCTAEGEASFTYTIGVRYLMDVYVKEKEDALELSGTIAPSATSPKFKCLSLETPSPTPPPDTQVPPTAFDVPLQVSAPGASGGDAFFQADGDNTQVTVEVKSFPQLTGPASIRSGTCDSPGPVVYPLIDDISKYQAFELNQPIASLLTGQNVIVVAGNDGTGVVGCGAIPKGTVITLGPGNTGALSPATAVLVESYSGSGTAIGLSVPYLYTDLPRPVSINQGACPDVGTVAYQLGDESQGMLQTTIAPNLSDLLAGGYSIQVGQDDSAPAQTVACGNLQ
jgi:hypothetical protein